MRTRRMESKHSLDYTLVHKETSEFIGKEFRTGRFKYPFRSNLQALLGICPQALLHELESKLLISPLITPIILPYTIPYITTFKEFRLQLI